MARKPRLHVVGELYHAVSRENNREIVFKDESDRRFFIECLADYGGKLNVRIYAYTLMDNHVHLLVEISDEPLAEFMRRLLGRYTQRFNRLQGRAASGKNSKRHTACRSLHGRSCVSTGSPSPHLRMVGWTNAKKATDPY